jgi:DNA-binding MarR family transcriptional regulator
VVRVSAALRLVTAAAEDDSPVATWTDGDTDLFVMAEDRARTLCEQTRAILTTAGANLIELRKGNAHLALGFDHFHELVEFYFGDLSVWKLVKDKRERIAERRALVASLTLAGYQHKEIHDELGASVGSIVSDQRAQGLISSRTLHLVEESEAAAEDPYRGLLPRWESLARVDAQGDRGLTSTELAAETGWPAGTPTGSLSKLAARGLIVLGGLEEARRSRRPYRITEAGRARLAEVLAARDAAVTTQ